MFDMTPRDAAHTFDVPLAVILRLVIPGSGIGHWRLGGKVQGITSLDLEAALERLREHEAQEGAE